MNDRVHSALRDVWWVIQRWIHVKELGEPEDTTWSQRKIGVLCFIGTTGIFVVLFYFGMLHAIVVSFLFTSGHNFWLGKKFS